MNHELPTFSVSDFLASINQTLDYAYPSVAIEGEVASFKVNQGKFVFFDIKDATGTVSCFMTLWQLRQPIEDGMKVVVVAQPKVTNWGKFSVTVQSIRPSGEGSIKKSLALLKEKLEREGLFAEDRKRPLPKLPKKVAVISSVQAAGYADFIKIINDRFGGMQIDVVQSLVQGADAPDQIIRGIEFFNQQPDPADVLVIIRGGGSADDLSAFNDEKLVRALAASRIPTLVGIGHEIDETLIEYAADARAATPSNAAQMLVPDKRELVAAVNAMVAQITPRVLAAIGQYHQDIKDQLSGALNSTMRQIEYALQNVQQTALRIAEYNPQKVLERGYAMIRGDTAVGADIEIETNNHIITAEVKHVTEK